MISKKLLKEFGIKKEYKHFNFPNGFTKSELYIEYLREFGVVPERLPAKKVLEIFNALVQDYKEKHITYKTLCSFTEDLYWGFWAHELSEISPEISWLMGNMADEGGSRDSVLIYAEDPEKYRKKYLRFIKKWKKMQLKGLSNK